MKGDTVIVRAFGNEPLVRRVWDGDNRAVRIVTDENYQDLEAGRKALNPVGFPRDDVFHYNARLLEQVQAEYETNPQVWKNLRVYLEG